MENIIENLVEKVKTTFFRSMNHMEFMTQIEPTNLIEGFERRILDSSYARGTKSI